MVTKSQINLIKTLELCADGWHILEGKFREMWDEVPQGSYVIVTDDKIENHPFVPMA
jgi:hypothetical protein